VTDRVEDVVVAAAVTDELIVRVRVGVIRGIERWSGQLARQRHGHPPAMAGSRRTSSAAPTGVASPSR
jgi:hypothetical protein